jgi:hypothetical protein
MGWDARSQRDRALGVLLSGYGVHSKQVRIMQTPAKIEHMQALRGFALSAADGIAS